MSYGGFRLTLVFAFLTSNYVACNGPQCFSCSHVPAVEDCTHIQTCADNEVCFSKMVIDSSANVYYKLGCTANNTCQQNSLIGKRQGSVLSNREAYSDSLACFRCCIDNFCNEKLCNPNYSVSHDRLRCLDCNDVLNPEDCDQIRECDWNQLCFISLQHGTSNLRYQMRCMGELQCRGLERFQSIHISHPSAKCCNDKDFCNLSCLNTTTPSQV